MVLSPISITCIKFPPVVSSDVAASHKNNYITTFDADVAVFWSIT